MKAVQIKGEKGAHQVVVGDSLPRPTPRNRELLIKVLAAGITADEVTWAELYATANRVPGHDLSGVVHALGPEYEGPMAVGDEVYAMISAAASQGCQAEFAIAAADEVTPKPASISHAQAAALPIPVLTAWEALVDQARLARGSRILVTGASGAVGMMLVQIARRQLDAHVVGLASAANHALLREIGAQETLDYRDAGWHETLADLDAVIDTVGGEVLAVARRAIKKDGVVVTVADPPPAWALGKSEPEPVPGNPGLRHVYFIVTARNEPLERVASLIDQGSVRPIAVRAFPVDKAPEAWSFARARGRREKAVITFDS
ncbi:hypothetical protein HIM_05845 [Hirsutella minnesotensis 3608]|uniref:Enoyl reductase (ER) domain-containing protein n=1 Tax=Hirsutella minnesotensis 3608 TaxID=1043627 RepID=A0A0F7ZUE6_9HYPO|nr:hypothetical protein HIM_05845 [Hirsutella minnesotensis 3608]